MATSANPRQPQPLKVLLPIHPGVDALDFIGPLELLTSAHFSSGPSATFDEASDETRAFICSITASTPTVTSTQGVVFSRHMSIPPAYTNLADYDVLLIPGGGSLATLEAKAEPLGLIKAFFELEKRDDGRERSLLSVCTGSLFLASQGVLRGLTATTHPAYTDRLRNICAEFSTDEEGAVGTIVAENQRFVVNPINEKGLRIITAGGVSCGLDAALWLVDHVAGSESRRNVEGYTQYSYRKGTTA